MNHLLLPQRELMRFLSSSASRWFTKIKSLADHFHDNVTHFGRKKKPVLCLPCIQIMSVSWPSCSYINYSMLTVLSIGGKQTVRRTIC